MPLRRTCAAAAALAFVLIVTGITVSVWNQSLRHRVAERQQIINAGLTYSQIYIRLANSLGAVAMRGNDEKVQRLLAEHGITMKSEQATPAQAPAGSR